MKNIEKFKLFRDIDIKVYWIDKIDGKQKSGILWNYVWIDSIMSANPNKNKLIEANFYEWDVKGDDGHWYTLPETDLYLDKKEKLI